MTSESLAAMEPMRVLIVGAGGFAGRHLLSHLQDTAQSAPLHITATVLSSQADLTPSPDSAFAEERGEGREEGSGKREENTQHPTPEYLNTRTPSDSELNTLPSSLIPHPLKVGIAWAGRPEYFNDRNRSCRLADFAPLAAVEGVELYSLQKGGAAAQIAENTAFPITDLAPELNDFTDTAAALANLDLVISVDTVIVHLAGALGRPVWTLLPHYPDWRWMRERADSPWYPMMHLFRQPEPDNWSALFAEVASVLASLASSAK